MSTVNKYLLPHRATKDVMKDASKSSMVLRKGELFVEAPSTGIGTGHSKIKIGDGKTIYSNLPYALGDTDNEVTNAIITFISNTGTSAKDVINGVKSGQSLATQIAGLKQAITLLANTPFTNRAFSTISDGNTQSVSATGTGDTLKVTAGSNVTLTFNNTNKSINIAAKDTTYVNATSSASGLMSAADKAKIDAISSGANKTAVTQKLSNGTNIGSVTIDGKTTELFAPTNTHYEAKNIVANSSTSTSDTTTALGNGSVNLNLVEDGKVRSSHTIKGSGATTVTTDTSGNIVINSIDNNTTYGQATDAKAGISKLYGTYGKNTDGSVTQDFITSELNNKLPIDGIAAKANQDSLGNNLTNYIDDAAVNGQTVTFIRGNGSTFSIHTQDNDTKYDDFVGATTAKNGGHGLVPAPTTSQTGYYLRGDGTWRYPSDVKVDNASNADRASTATVDSAGQNINTTYVKGVTGSNANVTVTKGNGATSTFTVNNVANAGTASYARSASTATADSAGNNINTTYVKSVTGAGATVTITKGNGATAGFIVDGVASAATATADSAGQIINTTYVKGVTGFNANVTVTKGDGSTAAFTVNNVSNASTANYAKAASTATVDSAGQAINTTYIKSLSVSGRTITFTKGNGATATITTQDTNTTYDAFKGATSSANGGPGLVPAPTTANVNQYLKGDGTWANISGVIAGTKVNNASEADHASRADNAATATADSAGQIINTTYVKGVTGSNATVTVTKGNGATAAFTVNNVANAGKATNDSAGQNINTTYIKSITYSGHTVTVTKGNGATSTFNTADNNTTYVTGTETTSGLTKLYGSSGTSTDGTMTRAAITNLVAQTKTTLETAIGKINSFEIVVIDQGGSLPTTGADHTVYFLPYASGDSDTKYEEYIWLTDYYEKIGMTTADLGNYYTKSETNTQITNATNSLVSSVTYSGHTVTITKKDGSTSSFATADNNTTYNAGTGLSLSGTTFSINAGASTVAHASSADSSTNDSAGNNINNTYVKGITYSGHTVTITKGNGSTTSFNTADNNTTYANFKGATSSANGGSGLVPAPTTAQTGYYLRGDGTWHSPSDIKVDRAGTADKASTATVDSAGNNINTTYIKSVTGSNATVTVTKGNGATTSFTINNVSSATSAGSARSASSATADSVGQNINTTYIKGVTGAAAVVTVTKGDGTTTGFTIDGVMSASSATADSVGQNINTTYIKGVTGSNAAVTVTKGDGTTSAFTVNNVSNAGTATYAESASTATVDSAGQQINTTYIKSLSVSGRTITYTKGNGTTGSITTQDNNTTYGAFKGATSSANGGSGLVPAPTTAQKDQYLKGDGTWASISNVISGTKVDNASTADYASSASSASTATADSAGQQINTTYIKGVTGSNATLTVTKGNGSTSTFTVNNVSNAAKASTATADSAGQNINTTYIKSITYSGHTVTVTKGNGTTSSFVTADNNTTYTTGNETTSGLTKLYGSSGTSADGTMTRAAITKLVNDTKTTLETAIGNINSFEIIVLADGEALPTTGANHTVYFVPDASGDADTKYAEYIWLTDYYEKIGMTTADLTNYYTKSETDNKISSATDSLVSSLSYSGHTLTITKKNGTALSFNTTDTNTTYSAGTGLSLSGTTFSINAGASTVAHASSADRSTNDSAGNNINNTYVKGITYSGHTVTITKGNGATTSFNTADNNTTYDVFKGATNSANGGTGLVPAPTTAQTGMYLKGDGTWANINGVIAGTKVNNASTADYASSASNSTKATNDSAGQNINTTYIKNLAVSGRTITFTKGNGATGTITTQDTNTTYNAGTGLSLSGTTFSINAGASTVAHASSADSSTKDSAGNNINSTYIKNLSVNGRTITFTKGNGSTTAITTQDTNTTYDVFKGATSSANGGNGLVPAPTTAQKDMYLKGDGTWANISGVIVGTKVTSAANADSAGKATNDSAGQNINTTYIKSLSVSGRTITYTKGNGATGTITTQDTDTNTTYSAGTGLTLSGTTFSINAGASTVAYATNAGNGISNITRSGTTFTVTRQNGSTFSFNQQDTNTTYGLASQSSNGLMSAADKKAVDREFFRMLPKGGTVIPNGANLNSTAYLKVGNYYQSANANTTNMTNIPIKIAFMMYVLSPLSETYDNESTGQWVYRLRIFVGHNGNNIFVQMVSSGATPGSFDYGPWVKMTNSNDLSAVSKIINDHIANKSNPHAVTKAQVGLGSVANYDQSKAIKSITRSGTTFTATALDGTTTTFTQQDSNTTYNNFKGATTATAGGNGLVPAPTTAQVGFYLRGDGTWHSPSDVKANNAGYSDSAGKATNDSAGNNINTTYIKSLSVNGRVITYTKGNGTTGSITTQDTDTNTTYSAGTGLTLSGTTFSINAGASTVAYATNAGNSGKATNDSAGNNINSTYVKSVTYSGHTVTITKGNGSTTSFNTADNNTTYANFKGATSSANGGPGLVPGPTSAQVGMYLRGDGTWHSPSEYIKRTGDTMSGALNFANNTANAIGDDVYIGDFNKGGHLGILGKNNNTGITLIKAAGSWSTATSSASIDYDATNGCISFVFA